MTSWKTTWNLTWIAKINRIDCVLPSGFRDWVPKELQRVGCVELLNTVQRRVRPKLHVFGGIHEGKEQLLPSSSSGWFQRKRLSMVCCKGWIRAYRTKVGRDLRGARIKKDRFRSMCYIIHLHLSLCKGRSIHVIWKQFKFWQTWLEKQMRFPTLACQKWKSSPLFQAQEPRKVLEKKKIKDNLLSQLTSHKMRKEGILSQTSGGETARTHFAYISKSIL